IKAVKYIPNKLILVNLIAKFRISPSKPKAKSLTMGFVKINPNEINKVHNNKSILIKLFANSLALAVPSLVPIWVYMGMKTEVMPLAIKAKIVPGIFMDII